MKMEIPDYAKAAHKILNDAGFESYCVGGCVRDSIMGQKPHDWDICTNCTPQKMLEIFKDFRTIETGLKHGTVTIIIDSQPVEITTYRSDGEYSDHRKPDNVQFVTSLAEDLKRRDFTINSLAYSIRDGFVDLYGGVSDIEHKKIRCVGNPTQRFDEDALRILRGLRFSSRLGFEIESDTAIAMREQKNLLKFVSSERIFSELNKLLCGDKVTDILLEYSDVIGVFIPELLCCIGVSQNNPHHCYTVYEHICHSVGNIQADSRLRLVMLLHDISKPECRTVDEAGINHFKMHQFFGADKSVRILKRLKADNNTIHYCHELINEHDNRLPADSSAVKRFISKHGYDIFVDYLKVRVADTLAQSEYKREEKLSQLNQLKEIGEQIYTDSCCLHIKDLAIKGSDCISLGYEGKEIGDCLKKCLEAVIDNRVDNEYQKLMDFLARKVND